LQHPAKAELIAQLTRILVFGNGQALVSAMAHPGDLRTCLWLRAGFRSKRSANVAQN
jgi:hypothetical protein